jgi:hypothetical protein
VVVGRVHDGVDVERRDVLLDDPYGGHRLLLGEECAVSIAAC